MAKKNKEEVVVEVNASTKQKNKKDTKDVKKQSKKKDKKSVGQKSKELYSELKKVSWPSFGKVVKSTGVVLLVVIICTLVLFGADRLFSWLFTLLLG
ncbi:MAG: preprotein translocase subunit SecE [Clostridia bacterium]|nr:preprotein translocase subunit SecE [Clostridia bacterium]